MASRRRPAALIVVLAPTGLVPAAAGAAGLLPAGHVLGSVEPPDLRHAAALTRLRFATNPTKDVYADWPAVDEPEGWISANTQKAIAFPLAGALSGAAERR